MSTAKGSGEELRSWAKKQLGFDDDTPDSSIPAVYMSELRKHATWYPLDMNFSIVLQEGSGFGIVTCLESGCDSAVVRLGKRPSVRDGGIRDGLGSLSAYRVHITRCLAHVASRDARVKAEKATQAGPSSTFSSSTSHHLRRNLPPKMEPQDSSLSLTRRSASASVAKSDSRERLLLDSQPTSTVASVPSKRPSSPLLKTSSPLIKVKDEEPELIDLSLFDARPVKKVKTEPDSLPSPSTPTKKPLSQANRASPRGMFHTLPTPQSTADIRARIGDLQSNIADINGQIARVRRKSIPSRAELLRVAAWERDRADMEAEKARLSAKIPGVSRNGSWASVKDEHNPYANAFNMPTTPVKKDFDEDDRVNYLLDPSSSFRGDAHLPQTPVASGSNVRLPPSSPSAPPTSPFRSSSPFTDSDEAKPLAFTAADVKPTIVLAQSTAGQETGGVAAGKAKAPDVQPMASSSKEQRLFPVPAPQNHQVEDEVQQYVNGQLPNLDDDDEVYDDDGNWFGRGRDTFEGPVANPDDIDKFLIAAGNAEQFDGNAKVDDALVTLGLPGLYQPLPGMEIALMPHQAIGVAWMLDRERGPHKGGCLSDEMGLGKTVQMLATLVSNQSRDPLKKSTLIVAPLALLDQWQMEVEMKTNCDLKCLIYHGSTKVKRRVDLQKYDIVLTTFHTLAMEWPDPEEQVKKARKNKKGGNKVDYWDGESSSSEEDKKKKKVVKKRGLGILLQMDWYRVILDEAQNIRNKKTRISRAVTKLEAVYRWALTGTPIVNSLSDAYAIIRFLRIRPWYDWVEFNNQVAKPERKQPSLAATRLQAIFTSMLLRRKKDTMLDGKRLIELPPKEVHLTKLEFTAEERDVYRIVETQSQATFNRFLQAGTVLKNYTQVLVLLLRLRQICSHPSLIQESGNAFILPVDESDEGVSYEAREELERARKQVSSEFVARMKYKLRDVALKRMAAEQESADATVEDEECPICFDTFTAAIVTPCTHIFCRECIGNVLAVPRVDDVNDQQKYKANEHPCPTCRSPICKEKLYARSAFMPTDEDLKAVSEAQASGSNPPRQRSYTRLDSDIEMLDDEAVKPIDVKGKGRARRFVARKRLLRKAYDSEDDSEHEDADDNLSDFIVQSDEDEEEKEERMKLKKRLGKTKARPIVLDSDDDEVVFGKKKHVQDLPKEQIKLMPKFLPSTKMKHMMELICDWADKNPNEKTIVISQWTQCLTLVSDYLTERGIVHVKYQGDMARNKRDQAVRVFMGKESATVMLMSLKCGGVGLNLTRANRVISLDLAWSSAVESQAFDRVHRLGQMREVFVHRLVIENTVEDRVLMLQERKQALADGSLGEGAGKKLGRLSVKELANLFGLDHRGRVLN